MTTPESFAHADFFTRKNKNSLDVQNLRVSKDSRYSADRKLQSAGDLIMKFVETFFCKGTDKPTTAPTPAPTLPEFKPLTQEEITANLETYENLKFSVALREFDKSILDGYSDCDDLIDDIKEVLQYIVNSIVKSNMITSGGGGGGIVFTTSTEISEPDVDTASPEISELETGSTEDSFETNNQVEGVDEADIVKSDGTFVYTVYGSDIIVLDVDGNELFRLEVGEMEGHGPYYGPIIMAKDDPGHRRRASADFFHRRTTSHVHRERPIKGLLLDGDKLVAISTGYEHFFSSTEAETEVVIIDIDLTSGVLNITERKTFPGIYKTARMIGSDAHLVTSSYVEMWNFKWKFYKWNRDYEGMNATEYAETAFNIAATEIPEFAANLVEDLLVGEDSCQHIAQISSLQNGLDLDDDDASKSDLLNSLVSIVSFNIPSGFNNATNVSASFTPNSNMDIYATSDMIFLGSRGWAATEGTNSSTDVTYITVFELSGASAVPNATGVIPGYTLNQFSFDYYKNYLRVATSSSAIGQWNSSTWEFDAERNATNQIIIAQIIDDEISIVGELEGLGETERIFAVRFMGDRAFMVTFRQIDPFYTIDLSEPESPAMKGELKIPGFSNYLHPVDDDFILAVGQDADDNGMLLGLQIALFNVSDMTDPQQVAKHVIKGWSFSESQNDHLAFRYLAETEKLILPVSNSTFDGFQVFDITVDTEASIELDFVVSHYDIESQGSSCYGGDFLKPRSLVFSGDMMTLKGHSIVGHDLDTGSELYRLDLDDDNESFCFGWFW